eukprot:866632-Pelagomonas_calceolata.AAC.2
MAGMGSELKIGASAAGVTKQQQCSHKAAQQQASKLKKLHDEGCNIELPSAAKEGVQWRVHNTDLLFSCQSGCIVKSAYQGNKRLGL